MHPLRRLVALYVVFALVSSAGCLSWPGPTGDPRVVKLYGGEDGYELIAIPALANVRAYRVEPSVKEAATSAEIARAKEDTRPILFDDNRVIGGPVSPDHEALMALSRILKDERSYDWIKSKACLFHADVVVRFVGHDTTVDVVMCFTCRELAVYKNGALIGNEDFDAKSEELGAIAREWFAELKVE